MIKNKYLFFLFCVQQLLAKIYNSVIHKKTVIYMFHKISDDNDEFSMSKENFIYFIKNNKESIISMDDLYRGSEGIVLTFDDVFQSVYYEVFETLVENNIPFSIFVSDKYLYEETDNYINCKILNEMAKYKKCSIGFHTRNHKKMRSLSMDECYYELNSEKLENNLGKKIDYFAFPYGSFDAVGITHMRLAKKMYKIVLITWPIYAGKLNRFCRIYGRININDTNYKDYLKK